MQDFQLCPYCGRKVSGDPWNIKKHVQETHHNKSDFPTFFDVIIRKWLKT